MEQFKFSNLADASEKAISVSKEGNKYSCVVLSKGEYYVENETCFVRSWEEKVAEYQNGKLIPAE